VIHAGRNELKDLPGNRLRKPEEAQPGLHYLDAGAGLAQADGSADPRLIRLDRIHLNREGNVVWAPPGPRKSALGSRSWAGSATAMIVLITGASGGSGSVPERRLTQS
jgi:hypothetical protein